jgi:hypothetical protein
MKKNICFMLFAITSCCIQLKASDGIDSEQQRNKRNLAVFLDSEVDDIASVYAVINAHKQGLLGEIIFVVTGYKTETSAQLVRNHLILSGMCAIPVYAGTTLEAIAEQEIQAIASTVKFDQKANYVREMELHISPEHIETYQKSVTFSNVQDAIFDFFTRKGYEIDIYFTTNPLNETDTKQICERYKPVRHSFVENEENFVKSRNKKLNGVIDLCIESGIAYDLILITRFDLLFQKDFDKSNIKLDSFNLVSILEKPHLICDNFYLFPATYLDIFSKIVKKNLNTSFHMIQEELYTELPENAINYILNEHCVIADLSFYKIVRTLYVKPVNPNRFKLIY